jgi:cytochrome b subunit of formate dehydrogenase
VASRVPALSRARTVLLIEPASGFQLPRRRIRFGAAETDSCFRCHGLPNFMVRDSATRAILFLTVDPDSFRRSMHGKLACTQCHGDITEYPHQFKVVRRPVGCDADCHARDAKGKPVRHDAEMADFKRSAHRKGLTGENLDDPTCLTCHGAGDPHAIGRFKQAVEPREKMRLCAPCHDDRERMTRSRVEPDAVASYRRSFHYKAIRFGSTKAAVCQDCHAVHRVIAPDDTASTVNAGHLAATCGQENCHKGANVAFAMSGANHLALRARHDLVLAGEEGFFWWLGIVTLLLLGVGVFLDARHRIGSGASRLEAVADPPLPAADASGEPRVSDPPSAREPLVQRLSLAQRLQHGALVLSFIALAVTGLPLRFPESRPLAAFYHAIGGLEVARRVHRGAAGVMVMALLAHLIYAVVLLARAGFDVRRAWPMLPTRKDARDWWEASLHYFGRRAAPPAFDRHNFREKVHYFAVLWGVPVMTFSGLVLGFPIFFGNRLPDRALGMAYIAHSDEAILAISAIVVWHLYNVHVSPGRFHRFRTWLDGWITREEMIVAHPREYERVTGERIAPAERERLTDEVGLPLLHPPARRAPPPDAPGPAGGA